MAALRTIRAYRTVSDEAAFVLSGIPPVDLIAVERARIKAMALEAPLPGGGLSPPEARSKKRKGGSQLGNGKVDGKSP